MLHDARMAGSVKLRCGIVTDGGGRLWAGSRIRNEACGQLFIACANYARVERLSGFCAAGEVLTQSKKAQPFLIGGITGGIDKSVLLYYLLYQIFMVFSRVRVGTIKINDLDDFCLPVQSLVCARITFGVTKNSLRWPSQSSGAELV